MRDAAANLEFEEAARFRDELRRRDRRRPAGEQRDVEAEAGRTPPHKPTAEMGPHNFGGGNAKPRGRTGKIAKNFGKNRQL
jgi:excinuclease ABC subunit B